MSLKKLPAKLGFLNPKNTLFLLCDVQEKFRFMNYFKEFSKNTEKLVSSLEILKAIVGLIDVISVHVLQVNCSKILDIPLIVTEQNSEKLGKTISELDIKHARGVFDKTKFSMCIPEVGKILDREDIESIVVFGLETHICVDQTCLDLLETQQYEVHVVADCVLSRSSVDRDFALERLRSAGCVITTSENVIFKLLRDKNHPKFNEVRKLVSEPTQNTFPNKL
jgi:isochorismate hydrolase